MDQTSPYDTPGDNSPPPCDPELLRQVAARLAASRRNPPTVAGLLFQWPGTPVLVLVGIAGTAILTFLSDSSGSALMSHWPVGFAAMIFGAFLRDIGMARRVKKLWRPQSYFVDWAKVEELAE